MEVRVDLARYTVTLKHIRSVDHRHSIHALKLLSSKIKFLIVVINLCIEFNTSHIGIYGWCTCPRIKIIVCLKEKYNLIFVKWAQQKQHLVCDSHLNKSVFSLYLNYVPFGIRFFFFVYFSPFFNIILLNRKNCFSFHFYLIVQTHKNVSSNVRWHERLNKVIK